MVRWRNPSSGMQSRRLRRSGLENLGQGAPQHSCPGAAGKKASQQERFLRGNSSYQEQVSQSVKNVRPRDITHQDP